MAKCGGGDASRVAGEAEDYPGSFLPGAGKGTESSAETKAKCIAIRPLVGAGAVVCRGRGCLNFY